jgi:hypothetical protein
MGKMLFKVQYTIRDLHIPENENLDFTFEEKEIAVSIRSPNQEEEARGFVVTNSIGIASGDFHPSDENLQIFEQIKNNKLLKEDSNSQRIQWSLKSKNEIGQEILLPGIHNCPQDFQDFIRQTHQTLLEALRKIISVLRWRLNKDGFYNPLSAHPLGMKWSFDGSFWYPIPPGESGIELLDLNLAINGCIKSEIVCLCNKLEGEPVYHELFREAWSERILSPRSSLIMGVCAAEIAIKQCISHFNPSSEWLLDNLPSPPIHKMFSKYLPELTKENRIDNNFYKPPTKILKTLQSSVESRNKIAHIGKEPLSKQELTKSLLASN